LPPLWRNQAELEAHLDGNEEGFVGTAPCAFKGAQIEALFARLDAGQPHRFATLKQFGTPSSATSKIGLD
jgi:hypothetical protein